MTPGTRLGPYQLIALVGAGGMGQVWKARDTRLDRIVAIKTSAAKFSERFETEARAVAALNHPHICTLHDVGPDYLVMEYVEGHEIKGPMPLDQALTYAIQLASALEAAHRKGITHRDLKPANILVTKAGIKVLDFGLAKIEQTKAAGASDEAATRAALTQEGSILGTVQYMAPEQLQGKVIDTRADIFSFGCVLYEMLTGTRAFDGANSASVTAAILERPAPSVSGVAPAALDRVLKKCLVKDPDDRWQSAGDLKTELTWIASGGTEVPGQADPTFKKLWIWGAASLLIAASAAFATWVLKPAPVVPALRTVIDLAPDERFANLNTPVLAISPDGSNIVYVASRGTGPAQLLLRPLNALKTEPLAGTENAASPFFSPDSQWIGFFTSGKLKKVAVAGGAAVTLCDANATTPGGTWGPNNTILFQSQTGALSEVPADGGTPRRVTATAKHLYNRWPEFTPSGGAFVFAGSLVNGFFATASSIAAGPVGGGGADKDLIAAGSAPRLTGAGDLIYAQSGTLMAVPFNSKRLELAGSPVPVLEGVRESSPGAAQYGLSSSGTLVYVSGGMQGSAARLVWVDRAGKEQPPAAAPHGYTYPRLSPDGRHIAVAISETTTDVWLYDLARDALSRATFGGTNNDPVWSPDGKRLVFNSNRAGAVPNLFWQPADGSGTVERLTTSQFINAPQSWSPDGQTIAFSENTPETGIDIWTLALKDRKVRPFLKTPANESDPRFSPDGHWIAYVSDESGRMEVYVQPYPGPGGKWQISAEGGTEPVWNPTGRELFYRSGNRMMAEPVTLQPEFSAGKPVTMFEGPWLPSASNIPNYDVSRDGQRFLMLKAADEDQGARQIVVVQNWLEELKKRKK
jgi:serine/threonine protein kinase/Tol biopolymer transport system component